MTNSWQSERAVIKRLRIRGAGPDPTLARLRLTSLLDSLSLHPAGLPPSAIVFIKQIQDPLPGHLTLQHVRTRPPSDWERAINSLLEQVVRRAERPALGQLNDHAEAVLFLDRSELLACLADDWCHGNILGRWWWRSLLSGPDIARSIIGMWLDAIEYIPAALNQLSTKRQAITFIRALSTGDTQALLNGITRKFGLNKLASALDADGSQDDSAHPAMQQEKRVEATWHRSGYWSTNTRANAISPWRAHAPEIESSGLRFDSQCLLGIGLMLHRAPSAVRSQEFARSIQSWRRATIIENTSLNLHSGKPDRAGLLAGTSRASKTQPEKPAHLVERQTRSRTSGIKESIIATPGAPSTHETGKPLSAEISAHPQQSRTGQKRPDNVFAGPHASEDAPSELEVKPAASLQDAVEDESVAIRATDGLHEKQAQEAPSPAPSSGDFLEPDEWPEFDEVRLVSEYGGIFYLINLGLFLDLYSDFTCPAETETPLSIWDFVALLAARLSDEEILKDPVWPVLAMLAGRTVEEAPGQNFDAPQEWRMPADWLQPFGGKTVWNWTTEGGRLHVSYAGLFTVLDVPLTGEEVAVQLSRELGPYPESAKFELQPGPSTEMKGEIGSLERWLEWLTPYARLRLERALAPGDDEELSLVLFKHRAHIVLTATHLDVYMSLADLPVEVRLSGLDRDPGWVPAAGRFIAFHFD